MTDLLKEGTMFVDYMRTVYKTRSSPLEVSSEKKENS